MGFGKPARGGCRTAAASPPGRQLHRTVILCRNATTGSICRLLCRIRGRAILSYLQGPIAVQICARCSAAQTFGPALTAKFSPASSPRSNSKPCLLGGRRKRTSATQHSGTSRYTIVCDRKPNPGSSAADCLFRHSGYCNDVSIDKIILIIKQCDRIIEYI